MENNNTNLKANAEQLNQALKFLENEKEENRK